MPGPKIETWLVNWGLSSDSLAKQSLCEVPFQLRPDVWEMIEVGGKYHFNQQEKDKLKASWSKGNSQKFYDLQFTEFHEAYLNYCMPLFLILNV